MPELQDVDVTVLDESNLPEVPEHIPDLRTCHGCGRHLGTDAVECPGCGAINLDRKRRRQEKNRPTREAVQEVVSGNHNGKYTLYRNSDGSLSCTCYSFLFQRGVENGVGYSTCKHIRDYLGRNPEPRVLSSDGYSEWQEVALKRFGVQVNPNFTDAQAYFVFHDLLSKQGVRYKEYEHLLVEHGRVNLLPVYSFGVEFEGMVRGSREEFKAALSAVGIEADIEGYSTALSNNWKIATDGSIQRVPVGHTAIELKTPKLFGSWGFAKLKAALRAWNGHGSEVNGSCGTHVHIDAWNWEEVHMRELAKIWAKIEQKVLWFLVSPSRRNNHYCRRLDRNYLVTLEGNGSIILNRYHSLNLSSFHRHRTIEFRLHNSTTDSRKIIPWIIFLLKLTDAVKKGLTHRDVAPEIESVLGAVGMDESATSVIRNAREYLVNRFIYWKEDAERNPSRMPEAVDIDLAGIEEEAERVRVQSHYQNQRWNRLTERNDEFLGNSVQNLASLVPSTYMPYDRLEEAVTGESPWQIPARNGNSTFAVTQNSEDDTLACTCRGFRGQGHCYHTISVARFLVAQRQEVR